jgi:hypothetical protein
MSRSVVKPALPQTSLFLLRQSRRFPGFFYRKDGNKGR